MRARRAGVRACAEVTASVVATLRCSAHSSDVDASALVVVVAIALTDTRALEAIAEQQV
jgi:hypothetical protein